MDPIELGNAIDAFAELDPTMQISNVITFLLVAQRGVVSQKEIEIKLGLSGAAASRNVAYWTEAKSFNVPGYGFIERSDDPRDRRSKLLRLSPLGKRFYQKIQERKLAKKGA